MSHLSQFNSTQQFLNDTADLGMPALAGTYHSECDLQCCACRARLPTAHFISLPAPDYIQVNLKSITSITELDKQGTLGNPQSP